MRRITEFEINEQVFVPAGDGEAAQWKRWGDLKPSEFSRNVQGEGEALERLRERTERFSALINEVRQGTIDRDGHAELNHLEMTLGAARREHERRRAAIDRDAAAGRFWGAEA
jgi:hypothetical protein